MKLVQQQLLHQADVTTMKASYAIGSFTSCYVQTLRMIEHSTGIDEEMSSFKIIIHSKLMIYQLAYGEETHETSAQTVDEEFDAISVSYTTGGMTITAAQYNASGLGNVAGS